MGKEEDGENQQQDQQQDQQQEQEQERSVVEEEKGKLCLPI